MLCPSPESWDRPPKCLGAPVMSCMQPHLGQGRSTAGVVDDLIHSALDIVVALSIVMLAELG